MQSETLKWNLKIGNFGSGSRSLGALYISTTNLLWLECLISPPREQYSEYHLLQLRCVGIASSNRCRGFATVLLYGIRIHR
jgi:hypothetical protein